MKMVEPKCRWQTTHRNHDSFLRWLGTFFVAAVGCLRAVGQDYTIDWVKSDGGGGGEGTGGLYSLSATLGLPDAGERRTSGPYSIIGGFWALLGDPTPTALLQTNVTWNNVVGNWSVATNWTPTNYYPNNGNGGYDYDVTISGGTATLTEDISIDKLTFESGTLAGNASLTVNDTFDWLYGSIIESGAGALTLRGGGTVSGGYGKDIRGRTIINEAGSTWNWKPQDGWGIRTGLGTVLENRGVVDVHTNALYNGELGGTSVIVNRSGATFRKSDGTGELAIGVPVINEGTFEIQSGTLRLQSGSTNKGTFDAEAGTRVYFGGGTNSWDAGAVFTGDGHVIVDGAAILQMHDGSYFSPSYLQSAGTIVYNGHAGLNDVLFEGGFWRGDGSVTVLGTFDWPYGAVIESGAGPLTLRGGGTVSGGYGKDIRGRTIINEAGSTWNWKPQDGWGFRTGLGTLLENRGVVDIPTNALYHGELGGTSVIVNRTDAIFRKSDGTGELRIAVPFINEGTVEVQSGTLRLESGSTNTGTFHADSGAQINFGRGTNVWDTGAKWEGDGYAIVDGYAEMFMNDNQFFSPSYLETIGTIHWNDDAELIDVSMSGTWDGPGAVTVYGTLDWPAAVAIEPGAGPLTLLGGGTAFEAGLPKVIRGRRVTNKPGSTWNWETSLSTAVGTVLENYGTVAIQAADVGLYGDGTTSVSNKSSGIFRKSGGTGTATMAVPFVNEGEVLVASGTLAFNGGFDQKWDSASLILSNNATVSATSDLVISNGYVRGSGEVNAYLRIRENATIAPGFNSAAGTLTINNNLYVAGTLEAHIGGPEVGDYDSIKVPAHHLLFDYTSANLKLRMLNGYHPGPDKEFVIAEGLFANETIDWFKNVANGDYLQTEDGGAFRVHYGPNSLKGETKVVLTDYKACPEINDAPEINCGGPIVKLAASADGVHVSFTNQITVTDKCYPKPTVVCTPPDGSLFPPGVTVVSCTATDPGGLTDSCSFKVTVKHIEAKPSPGGLTLEWAIPGAVLEVSDEVTGPWEEVLGATSPFSTSITGTKKMFRIRFPGPP